MANAELVDRLRQGSAVWNDWRKKHLEEDLNFSGAVLTNVSLSNSKLSDVNLRDARLSIADLTSAPPSNVDLSRAVLRGAVLRGADLHRTDLSSANLRGADLRDANLSSAFLSVANLRDADLRDANLSRADLTRADLRGAILRRMDLSNADLSDADLSHAALVGADLRGADLSRADLSRADLHAARLHDAHFSATYFDETILSNTNLRSVQGLETCQHRGPSTIDFRTLAQSGPLPLTFLRGVGLPDNVIAYLPSFLNEPLVFYSCFISYSTEDQAFTERLYADLQSKGVRCWFAPHDIQSGKKIHEQIDQAIRVYDKLLLILSDKSINSGWVEFEIRKARKREVQEQRRVLFPIGLIDYVALKDWECFDADTKKDLATEIREYFIPDFSTWTDHDSYQKAFTRLLRDLKAEAKKNATPEG